VDYQLITGMDADEHISLQSDVCAGLWPKYMSQGPVLNEFWYPLFSLFADFQFFLETPEGIIGLGNSLPLRWDKPFNQLPEGGWDWALETGIRNYQDDKTPNVLNGVQVLVTGTSQGQGISYLIMNEMKKLAQRHDLDHIIIAVRPTHKSRYPLTPMTDYITWQRDDGLPFDPWLRAHVRGGARVIKPCHKAMYIPGTIAEWEQWTGMQFVASGSYIIPGALAPVTMDLERDIGEYHEPNVWVVYDVASGDEGRTYM